MCRTKCRDGWAHCAPRKAADKWLVGPPESPGPCSDDMSNLPRYRVIMLTSDRVLSSWRMWKSRGKPHVNEWFREPQAHCSHSDSDTESTPWMHRSNEVRLRLLSPTLFNLRVYSRPPSTTNKSLLQGHNVDRKGAPNATPPVTAPFWADPCV
jgi:hypothetical protein